MPPMSYGAPGASTGSESCDGDRHPRVASGHDADPAGPARRRRHPLSAIGTPSACATTTGRPTTWTLPRARPTRPDRGLATAGAGPGAGRPDPDLEPVDPGAAGRLLRGDARAARPRPLDLRMSADAIETIVRASGARHLILGTAATRRTRARPVWRTSRRRRSRTLRRTGRRRPAFPADWEARQAAWGEPTADEVFELVFTSGTTGTPKGVMLTHDNVVASIESFHRIVPPMDHRIVSLLPLTTCSSRRSACTTRSMSGADILYVRSRNPRVIFDALRDHRVTSMVVVPQVLDLFWSAIEREVDKRGRPRAVRAPAWHRPAPAVAIRRLAVPERPRSSSAGRSGCSCHRARSCRRPCSRPGRTSGSPSSRATARRRPGRARARRSTTTARARSGGSPEGIEMRIADDGEIQFRGRTVFTGYWKAPELTAEAFTEDGWYRTGDLGHFDDGGPARPERPDQGHHRAAQRLQRVPRGHRERPADRRAARCGRRRDRARPDRGASSLERPREAEPRRRFTRPGSTRAVKAANATPRAEPADRRLAGLARRGLPADPHAEDQARPGPPLGGHRRAAAGRDDGDLPSPTGTAGQLRDRDPGPERLERGLDVRVARIGAPPRGSTSTERPSSRAGG